MSSDPLGGGRSSSSTGTGGGDSRRPRHQWLWNSLWSLGGFIWQHMRLILISLVVVIGLWTIWNTALGVGKNFKANTMVSQTQNTAPAGQEPQQYGSDSDEESDQTAAQPTPAPATTPVPTPVPTSQPTPAPTTTLSSHEEKDREPERVRVTASAHRIRDVSIVQPPELPLPTPREQTMPASQEPQTLSQEELGRLTKEAIREMKEGQ